MLLGKTRGSWKGKERMSAGNRQECWRGAAEPRRVWANSTEKEGRPEGDLGTPPGRGRRENTGTVSAGNREVWKAKFPSSLKELPRPQPAWVFRVKEGGHAARGLLSVPSDLISTALSGNHSRLAQLHRSWGGWKLTFLPQPVYSFKSPGSSVCTHTHTHMHTNTHAQRHRASLTLRHQCTRGWVGGLLGKRRKECRMSEGEGQPGLHELKIPRWQCTRRHRRGPGESCLTLILRCFLTEGLQGCFDKEIWSNIRGHFIGSERNLKFNMPHLCALFFPYSSCLQFICVLKGYSKIVHRGKMIRIQDISKISTL